MLKIFGQRLVTKLCLLLPITFLATSCNDSSESAESTEEYAILMSEHNNKNNNRQSESTNRLINESSPYLLQHAHNPVDWYPWGAEAFEKAQQEQKPIFLSIGYSTCYWCHVMERECFENPEIAKMMNENFICIKVDREERPDVDDIYMAAVQIMTGSGGWPMSLFLTPPPPVSPITTSLAQNDNAPPPNNTWVAFQPFFAGTYFPPTPSYNRPSFPQILEQLSAVWNERKPEVLARADQIADAVKSQLESHNPVPTPINYDDINTAVSVLVQIFDNINGGFGQAPKFPQPTFLDFLIEVNQSISTADITNTKSRIDHITEYTLERMATGGMYDQIGGGFHRYSTDEKWLVPHFEKMLYDNGQLASLYAKAAEIYQNEYYAQIACEICDYIVREMTDPQGGFYSAQDAEVDHREGLNYLWTKDDFNQSLHDANLSDELVKWADEIYGLNKGTNFQDPHHPEDIPRNVIFLNSQPQHLARKYNLTTDDVNNRIGQINKILYQTRSQRKQPVTDDKIIVAWNGLMIKGFADTGRILKRADYINAANNAWQFINHNLKDEKGYLLRTWRQGKTSNIPAASEDYAFLISGLIALYQATGDNQLLADTIKLTSQANELFTDKQNPGGYYDTQPGRVDLFVRSKSSYDGAAPCANSVMLHNLLNLYTITGEPQFLTDAVVNLTAISQNISEKPIAVVNSTRALLRALTIAPAPIATIGNEEASTKINPPPSSSSSSANYTSKELQISMDPHEIILIPGKTTNAILTLNITPGCHINANNPNSNEVIPLSIEVLDNQINNNNNNKIKITADYPAGIPFTLGDQRLLVYTDVIKIPITITYPLNYTDTTNLPQIVMTYQICTDTACLAPMKFIIPITRR